MSSRLRKLGVRWNIASIVAVAIFAVLLLPAMSSAQELGDDLGKTVNTGGGSKKVYVKTYAYIGGSQVNIPNGAGWELKHNGSTVADRSYDGSTASGDTYTHDNAPTGGYAVYATPVSGWSISYNPQSRTLSSGESSETLKVKYTYCYGKLQFWTRALDNGSDVKIPAGGGWTLIDYPDSYSGIMSKTYDGTVNSWNMIEEYPAPIGFYEIEANQVPGWTATYNPFGGGPNERKSGELTKNGLLHLKVLYTKQPTGKLIVITEAEAGGSPVNIPAGGGYTLAGPQADNVTNGGSASGTSKTYDDTPLGVYTVTGKAVSGWAISYHSSDNGAGSNNTDLSFDGDEDTLTVKYTARPSTLIIDIEPNSVPPGAQYKVEGPAGFSTLTGQTADQSINIDGTAGKPFGTYTVTFDNAPDYTKVVSTVQGDFTGGASARSGSVDPGETHEIKGVYSPKPAKLIIDIQPNGGVPGGSYKVEGPGGFATMNNQTADQTIDIDGSGSKPFGTYTVTFTDASGYTESVSVEQGDFSGGALSKSGQIDPNEVHEIKGVYSGEPASLIIDIVPDGGVPGGTYKVEGPGGFATLNNQTADQTINITGSASKPFGTYTVTFTDATGYTETVSTVQGDFTGGGLAKSGDVDPGETHEIKGEYVRDTGTLNVVTELTGGGTLPAGSGWDLDDPKPADFSGTPTMKDTGGLASGNSQGISPAVTGNYSVTGRAVGGYTISYGPKNGALTKGGSLTLKVIYTRSEGESLNVITTLAGGGTLPAGSGWDLTTTPGGFTGSPAGKDTSGLGSGDNQFVAPVVTGNYEVTGRAVAGYAISYSPQNGSLSGGGGLTLEVIYTFIPPEDHVVDAIYWDPVGGVQVPGGTITPGATNVSDGGSQAFTAVTLPTGYELTGGCAFTGTGSCSMASNIGTVNNVMSDGTLRIYVQLTSSGPGELEVILLPNDVLGLGARWKYKNTASLKTSGTVETLDPGFYDIEATDVPDWITPGARNGVQVFAGQRTTVTMIYGQEVTGALQVFITDNVDERVRKLGAKWQPIYPASFGIPNDPNKWYNHGDIITGLPVGELGLRFKTLNGWILPELLGAEIVANKTTKETGRYWRVLIIHKSDYNGDGTDDLAVFNKGNRKWQVASISKPAGAPAATFDLFEKKFGRSDDIPTTGDYDGDGIADLAYWRETTGEWNVFKQFKLKNFGEMHDIPVPGDYNADGITDPALFRPSTGEWFIYDRELKEIITVTFGGAGYVPVPGNYDGDEAGRTELGVFHIESQQWRVAFWNEKKQQWVEKKKVRVQGRKIKLKDNFGAVGNVPVMADYDGDGATDLAVYKRRPSIYDVRDQFEIQLGEHLDIPVPNDWAGLGRVIPTIFNVQKGRWISVDDLLNAKHGKGGQPLMSGR